MTGLFPYYKCTFKNKAHVLLKRKTNKIWGVYKNMNQRPKMIFPSLSDSSLITLLMRGSLQQIDWSYGVLFDR